MKRIIVLFILSFSLLTQQCLPSCCNTSIADSCVKQLLSDSCAQLLLGQLVDALNGELRLLDMLIANKTGAIIDQLMHDQNSLLNRTDPAVVQAYCKIMDVATYNQKLIQQTCNNACLNPCRPRLGCKERRRFLYCTRYILGCYQQKLRSTQCKIACEC